MRAITCFILAIFLLGYPASSYAQNQQAKEPKKRELTTIQKFVSKIGDAQHKKLKKVENTNQLTKLTSYYWYDGAWEYGVTMKLTYGGNLLTEVNTMYEYQGEADTVDKVVNVYQNGLLESETFYELNYLTYILEPVERISYSYTGSGNSAVITEIIYESWSQNNWQNDGKDTYVVQNGMIESGISYNWSGSEWLESEQFLVEQTQEDLMITYQEWDGTAFVNFDREIYADATITELYNYFFSLNLISYLTGLYVDFPVTSVLYQEWTGSEWMDYSNQIINVTYMLESQSVLHKEISFNYWDGSVWTKEEALDIYYNGKTNPDSTSYSLIFDFQTQELEVYSIEYYMYDENENMIMAESKVNFGQGIEYFYKAELEWSPVQTSSEKPEDMSTFKLMPAYPNPFNPATNISFEMPKAGFVNIKAYDILGKFVAELESSFKTAGQHTVRFDAGNLSSGQYIIRMETPGFVKSQIVTLIK